jgi:hypothetical protein
MLFDVNALVSLQNIVTLTASFGQTFCLDNERAERSVIPMVSLAQSLNLIDAYSIG